MSNLSQEEVLRNMAIEMLASGYEKKLSKETIAIYVRALRDWPVDTLKRVIDNWIATEINFPSGPAALRLKLNEMSSASQQKILERDKAEAIKTENCGFCDSAGCRYVVVDGAKRARKCTHKAPIERQIQAVGAKTVGLPNVRKIDFDKLSAQVANNKKME